MKRVKELFYVHCGLSLFFVGWVDEDGLWAVNMNLHPTGFLLEGTPSYKGELPLEELKKGIRSKYPDLAGDITDATDLTVKPVCDMVAAAEGRGPTIREARAMEAMHDLS